MRPRAGLDRATVVRAAAVRLDKAMAEGKAGAEGLTLKALADDLGVKPPSLFNHVDGMDDLRRELTLLCLRECYVIFARATIGKAAEDAVWALADAYRDFVHRRPGLYSAMQWPSDPGDAEVQEASRELIGLVIAVLSDFGLQGDDALHAVRGLRSIVHGFASLEMAGGFGLPLDCDESYRRLIDFFIVYLRGRRGAKQTASLTGRADGQE
jgi:AcrR family transcriptional regulator